MTLSPVKALIVGLTIFAGSVFAAPVTWTVPSTTLTGAGSTVSGTFTYNQVTNTLSAINITSTGPNPGSFTFVDNAFANPTTKGGQKIASVSNGDVVFFVDVSTLPAVAGTPTSVALGLGSCLTVASGLCTTASLLEFAQVTLTSAAPAAATIPTLSEWAMIFMASLMAMFGYARLRRR